MNNGNPTGEVRPMIDREPPNAAEWRAQARKAGPRTTLAALPGTLERGKVGPRTLVSGECRLIAQQPAQWHDSLMVTPV